MPIADGSDSVTKPSDRRPTESEDRESHAPLNRMRYSSKTNRRAAQVRRQRRWAFGIGIVLFLSGFTALISGLSFVPVLVATGVGLATNLLATYIDRESAGRSTQPLWRRPAVWLSAGCVIVLVATFLRIPQDQKVPDITVQTVDEKLNTNMTLDLEPTGKETDSFVYATEGYAQLNVRVSIENHESKPLHGVSIELSYPDDVDVESEGVEKVDPSRTGHVYEYSIGTVEPGDPYYAMAKADQLEIPLRFYHQELCFLDETLMPVCEVLVWDTSQGDYRLDCIPLKGEMACITIEKGKPKPKPITRTVPFRIFSDGRPTISGHLSLTFGPSSADTSEDAGPKVLKIKKGDPDWDAAQVSKNFSPAHGEVLDSWSTVLGKKHPLAMRYRKVRLSGGAIHQELYVGGVLRKVLIGRDNWVGEQITDTDGVGGPDTDKVFARFLMLSWRESDFKGSYTDNIKMTPPEPIQTP